MAFTSLYHIEVLTLREYLLRLHAFQLQQIDREYNMHKQAWLNHQVTLTKEQGKKQVPIYKRFKDFFDYEKYLKELRKPKIRLNNQMKRMATIAKQVNSKKG
ncbi:hypothetical protein [Virgibacillus sp. Bac332]|uniref:hypothetical protein n=2 Tax=unclassified Virgibacillus TaxID=2620237 RepID=UPI00054D2AF6|nr:hypothetical protein [Virgibacillus sp. Bac332]